MSIEPTGAYKIPLVTVPTTLVLTLMELVKMPVLVPVSVRMMVSQSPPKLLVMVAVMVSSVVELVFRFESVTRTLTKLPAT